MIGLISKSVLLSIVPLVTSQKRERVHHHGDINHLHSVCSLMQEVLENHGDSHSKRGWPAYPYTGLEPLNVLATIAFIVFLLQGLLGLVDRLRLPTLVRARNRNLDDPKLMDKIYQSLTKYKKLNEVGDG